MGTELQKVDIMEQVIIKGDLSSLTPIERMEYYRAVCNSVGLNPLTQPFQYITLNGKLTLYARKDATDQIRNNNGVSIIKLERERIDDIYTVTAYATDKTGKSDSSIGAVFIGGKRGDDLANAFMKAETKAKRRVTLSICGLGMLDETELETIKDAIPTQVTVIEPEKQIEADYEPDPVHVNDPHEMTLEEAENVTSKEGVRYGDMTTEDLTGRTIGLAKSLSDGKLNPKQQDAAMMKLKAANMIINSRKQSETGKG